MLLPLWLYTSTICFNAPLGVSIKSSAKITAKGSLPTAACAHNTAWPKPNASVWRMYMQVMLGGRISRTCANSLSFWRNSNSVSNSYALSKWSSMLRLLRPVMNTISVQPASTASSTAYWIRGLSTIGSISLGLALVAGKKRVPIPATGKTHFLMGFILVSYFVWGISPRKCNCV